MIFFIIHINGECVILPSPLPKEAVAAAKLPVKEPGLCQVLLHSHHWEIRRHTDTHLMWWQQILQWGKPLQSSTALHWLPSFSQVAAPNVSHAGTRCSAAVALGAQGMDQADRCLLLPNSSRQSSSLSLLEKPLSAGSEAANINFISSPCRVWQPGPWMPAAGASCQELDGDGCPQAATHLKPCSLAAPVRSSPLCFLLSLSLSQPNTRQALL